MTDDRARPDLPLQPRPSGARAALRRHRRALTGVILGLFIGAATAGLPSPVLASSGGGGRRITDSENTRTVYLVVTALVLLAIGLAVYTWWFWRSTRREHEALAPLEVMADRKFLAADSVARQTILDGSRPVGAAPLVPGAVEPLLLPLASDVVTDADDASPPTVVIASIEAGPDRDPLAESVTEPEAGGRTDPADDEVEVATGRTDPPATNGDATNVDTADADAIGGDTTTATPVVTPAAAAVAPIGLETGIDETAGEGEDDDEDAVVASVADPDADADADAEAEAEATMAIDVVALAASTAAVPPVVATQPAVVAVAPAAVNPPPGDSSAPEPAGANGSVARPVPIDPGLPVPPDPPEPVRHLSLAELATLDSGLPNRFDENELHSTPSTGIPVVESAEAWVERQLAAARPPANGVASGATESASGNSDGTETDGTETGDVAGRAGRRVDDE